MPRIKSAKKRMRQSVKRTARNRIRKEKLKKAVKAFKTVMAAGEAAPVADGLKQVNRAIDKAKVKGILHKNTANRKKSRLARAVNRAAAAKVKA